MTCAMSLWQNRVVIDIVSDRSIDRDINVPNDRHRYTEIEEIMGNEASYYQQKFHIFAS